MQFCCSGKYKKVERVEREKKRGNWREAEAEG
jgi:hypothetical protein